MSFGTGIELRTGPSRGLRFARQALGILALGSLLLSASAPAWIAVASGILAAAYLAGGRFPMNGFMPGRLALRSDGSATVNLAEGAVHAVRCGEGWSSRLFSVVVLREIFSGRRIRCLICRSTNDADDYRRLLVWLRVAGSRGRDRPEHWA